LKVIGNNKNDVKGRRKRRKKRTQEHMIKSMKMSTIEKKNFLHSLVSTFVRSFFLQIPEILHRSSIIVINNSRNNKREGNQQKEYHFL